MSHTVVLLFAMVIITFVIAYVTKETFAATTYKATYCTNMDKCQGRPFIEGAKCDKACGTRGGCSSSLVCQAGVCQKGDPCSTSTILQVGDECKPECPNGGGCGQRFECDTNTRRCKQLTSTSPTTTTYYTCDAIRSTCTVSPVQTRYTTLGACELSCSRGAQAKTAGGGRDVVIHYDLSRGRGVDYMSIEYFVAIEKNGNVRTGSPRVLVHFVQSSKRYSTLMSSLSVGQTWQMPSVLKNDEHEKLIEITSQVCRNAFTSKIIKVRFDAINATMDTAEITISI